MSKCFKCNKELKKLEGKYKFAVQLGRKKHQEEFDLSKKRTELLRYFEEQFGKKSIIPKDILRMVTEQDKEFIRRLKDTINSFRAECYCEDCGVGVPCDRCNDDMIEWDRLQKKLDKLAGWAFENVKP